MNTANVPEQPIEAESIRPYSADDVVELELDCTAKHDSHSAAGWIGQPSWQQLRFQAHGRSSGTWRVVERNAGRYERAVRARDFVGGTRGRRPPWSDIVDGTTCWLR